MASPFEDLIPNNSENPFSDLVPENKSFTDKLANSAPVNAALGAGDAIKNTITGTASLIPGIKIKPTKSSEGTAYNLGNLAGNIASYYGGGEILGAAKLLPKIKSAVARTVGGNALFGAIQNPE